MIIGFFDSGMGGLTVLSQAIQHCPSVDYLYYYDADHLPYGEKRKEDIRAYVHEATTFLYNQGAAAIVIACNTATSAAINGLRSHLPIPVIGMEPAVSLAHRLMTDPSKRILVLATQLTLKEEKYRKLLQTLGIEDRVDGVALPELVHLAEQPCLDEDTIRTYLADRFSHLSLDQYGSVVLGCTHFPIYRSAISRMFPPQTMMVDGAEGTVNHLFRQVSMDDCCSEKKGSVTHYRSGKLVTDPAEMQRIQTILDRIHQEDTESR